MLRRQLVVHHHELGRARHEDRHIVLLVMIGVLPGHLDQAHPDKVVHHLLCVLIGHLVHLCEILNIVRYARLLKAQEKSGLLLGQHFIQRPIFRIICLHRPRIFDQIAVCDHRPKL